MIPTITDFNPSTAAPGDEVIITGTGFTGVTAVQFGGIEAFLFIIIDDTEIHAWPAIGGSGVVSVTNASGTVSKAGFVAIQIKVRIVDLPLLSESDGITPRDVQAGDLLYVYDEVKNILCKADFNQLPATGGGGGGGDGNVNTVLGSPFKVRNTDAQYEYDSGTNSVTISDIRLIGKTDYIVSASDVSNDFENYDETDNPDGQLVFDPDDGSVTIKNYQLSNKRHINIYADGIVNDQISAKLTALQAKIDLFDNILKPFETLGGTCLPWRVGTAIPAGWQLVTSLQGKILIGRDPSDSGVTDPLNGAVGSPVGAKTTTLVHDNLPSISFTLDRDRKGGGAGYDVYGTHNVTGQDNFEVGGISKPISRVMNGVLVNWIEFVGV